MNFRAHNRDGPARTGQLTIDKKTVVTPNILFLHTARCSAPEFSDIILTTQLKKTKKPSIQIGNSIFSSERKKTETTEELNNYLSYPKDVSKELHLSAFKTDTKNTECFLVPAKKEIISDVVKKNAAILYIVANAKQLFSQQSDFVKYVVELRETIGYDNLIYLPCVGDPTSFAFLSYIGVDLFDSCSAVMAARNSLFLSPTGIRSKNQLPELPCCCPVCTKVMDAKTMTYEELLGHNYYALRSEIQQVRNAITTGTLRELVEIRVRTSPQLSSMLRILDLEYYPFLEERTPLIRKEPLIATTKDSLIRPEVRRFQERVISRYEKPASTKILLLLPCSAKKPYSFSKSHKLFRERLSSVANPWIVHEVIITSPLAIVPRELELTSPASAYDIAVTGHWDEDEKKMIRILLSQYLQKNSYDTTIIHLPEGLQEFIIDLFDKPLITCIDSPTSKTSLDELSHVLQETTQHYPFVKPGQRTYENIRSLACYQFDKPVAELLMKQCAIRGKYPYQKIMANNTQLGMLTEERGLISLTLHGARRLAQSERYWVEIHDGFSLKGSVFSPGVKTADESIRIGDEVVIKKNDTVCGIGVALMNGREMKKSKHGEAVKIRHHY